MKRRIRPLLSTTVAAVFASAPMLAAVVRVSPAGDDGFSGAVVEFAANSANAELQFTGVASHNIEWTYVLNILKS